MTPSNSTPLFARGELVRAAVTVVGLLLLLALLWQTRSLILLTILGCLLGIAAKPGVDWLERRKIKRGLGSPIVVLGSAAFVAGIMLWSGPTLVLQFRALQQQVPAAIDKVDEYLEREHPALSRVIMPRDSASVAAGIEQSASDRLGEALVGQVSTMRGFIFGALTSTIAMFAGFIYVLFLTMYLAMEPFAYRTGILLLVPERSRARGGLLFDAITTTLRKWLSTQFIAMVVIGVVTTAVLLALQVKSAIPLGILAGILEFVPTFGPFMSAIPAVLIAFGDAPQKALIVGIAYWAIQFLENNLLIPRLMQEELDLPPALTLLWQALMAIVFGLLGLFVAVPLLAATMVSVRYLYVRGDVPPVRRPRGSRAIPAFTSDEPSPPSTA